ncbi:MAG: ABC transporter ATP-binding protein [Candidatus Dormibacteraeota bacterium]|nr:ABC transporter ATP-binding protein [Candidatus Dormibacteraeota bacterium]
MDPGYRYVRRNARRLGDSSGQSGLTGSPELPEPDLSGGPKDLRGRIRSIRLAAQGTVAALPRVIQLVWETSRGHTVGLGMATVLAGVVPAANAVTAKLLINAVLHAILVRARHQPDQASLALPLPVWTVHLPTTSTINVIVELAALQFLIYALSSMLTTLKNISQQLLQEGVTLRIQEMVMEHAAKLDLQFFEDSASYDLLRQAQQETPQRSVTMISTAFGLVQTGITFATMIALLLGLSPLLALVALVSPVPQFISDTRYGWRGYNIARWASPLRRRMQYLGNLVTTDTFAKEVKLFGLGGYFVQRFRLLAGTYFERQRNLVRTRYLVGYVWGMISTLVGSGTYLYVAVQAVAGRLTLGDLSLYTSAASSVQSSIQGLLSGFSGMYENNLYLNNLYDLLARTSSIQRSENPRPMPLPVLGEVVFEHVSFSYPGSEAQALEDVSLRIAPGETVAVVGRNGAGKSTLIKLLCRLYDPTRGRILLDGIDIKELDPDELRRRIGAMFQDHVSYQATASENIGLGDLPQIEDRSAIQAAAGKAGVAPLIEGLSDGYDTPLGRWFDHGANLSGGEWQKVALARAFMRDVPILILDEPTSALDAQAEYELFARLRALSRGRTAVYISHRFSTVRQADRILFFEHGKLVEVGTHTELMALGGRYARLFRMQASAYMDDPDSVDPAAAGNGEIFGGEAPQMVVRRRGPEGAHSENA